jgi:hypothetical protein
MERKGWNDGKRIKGNVSFGLNPVTTMPPPLPSQIIQ